MKRVSDGRRRPARWLAPVFFVALLPVAAAAPPGPQTPGQHLRRAPVERPLPGPGRTAVGRFLSARHAPRGPRAGGKPGDYFVRTTELVAVLRAANGVLADVAPGPDFIDRVGWAQVYICQGRDRHSLKLEGFQLLGGSRPAVEVRASLPALGLEVRTRYHVPPAAHRLELESELRNKGPRAVEDVALCEEFGLGNTRLFVPGVGEVRRSQKVDALFAARREAGVSYVLMRMDGKSLHLPLELFPPQLAFDPALNAVYQRGRLLPGEQRRVRRQLVVRQGPLHDALAEALASSALPLLHATVAVSEDLHPPGMPPTLLQVRRDGKPFLLTQAERQIRLSLPREGRYSVALLVPGVGEGQTVPLAPPAAARPKLPVWAALVVSVVDTAGHSLPARLHIQGVQGTADPAFGSDEGLHLENVAYLGGPAEKLLLAPGAYQLSASRGPHYAMAPASVRLAAGQTRQLALKLKKVVRTEGWLSADLHLHTSSSFDSPLLPAERVAAGAARGMDLLVFTDHNVVTAKPTAPVASRSAGASLPYQPMVISGQEVTTHGRLFGHFNIFPLEVGREIAAGDTTPAQVFGEARRRVPAPLIQVNHPRMGSIGYFDQMRLEPASGRAAAAYHPGYDLLEVLNGDDLDRPEAIDRVLRDWYQLLNRGLRYVATAGSDSHRPAFQETGSPRTLILWDPAEKGVQPTEAAALAALRAGRAVASSGPMVRFSLDGKPLGALLRGGRPLLMRLRVEAPAWMAVNTATLIANGVAEQTYRARPGDPLRLEAQRRLQPKVDTWYVVVVRGDKQDPTLLRKGVLPFAVTNPIFVDVDGDGQCLPPAATSPASTPAKKPAPVNVEEK